MIKITAEEQPLLVSSFDLTAFEKKIDQQLAELRRHYFLRPEWFNPRDKVGMLINSIPAILAFAAILYPALILNESQSAYDCVQAVVSFLVNYPQFFIPIAAVISEPLGFYRDYIHHLRTDGVFHRRQPNASFVFAVIRDVLSIPIGYFTAGLWPSVAKDVKWLNNPAFQALILPASISMQVIGSRALLDRMFTYVPPFTDHMLVASYQRNLIESFLRQVHNLQAMQLALPRDKRAGNVGGLLATEDVIARFPLIKIALEGGLFLLAFHWFAISNLGNAKTTALDEGLSAFEKIASIVFGTYGFGAFGALIVSGFAPYLLSTFLSKGRLIVHNLEKMLLALACVGVSVLSALPAEITFGDTWAVNGSTPHTVNLPPVAFAVLKKETVAGSTYANCLWLALFAGSLLIKTRKLGDPFLLRTQHVDKAFQALDAQDKIAMVSALCQEHPALVAHLEKDLCHLLKGTMSVQAFLELLQDHACNPRQIREMIDAYGKAREWSLLVISGASAAMTGAVLFSTNLWPLAVAGSLCSETTVPLAHRYFDRQHESVCQFEEVGNVQEGSSGLLRGQAFFSPPPANNTAKALEVLKAVATVALPLAVYWGTFSLAQWAARNLFETTEAEAKQVGETWAKASTTVGVFAASMMRCKR